MYTFLILPGKTKGRIMCEKLNNVATLRLTILTSDTELETGIPTHQCAN